MDRTQILETIKALAKSQGFYGRLLTNLQSLDDKAFDDAMTVLENQKFRDAVDMILFFEG